MNKQVESDMNSMLSECKIGGLEDLYGVLAEQ